MKFPKEILLGKALAAVEEVAREAEKGPVQRTLALRFTLAFLANFVDERWYLDSFWKNVTMPAHDATEAAVFGRRQSIMNAINGIYVQLGARRPGW